MTDNIFDLEQQIMQAWNVVDDIDMLYTYFGDGSFQQTLPHIQDQKT